MRLLTARDYERVFQQAQKSSGKALTVLARHSGRASARLGLAIPRRLVRNWPVETFAANIKQFLVS